MTICHFAENNFITPLNSAENISGENFKEECAFRLVEVDQIMRVIFPGKIF